MTSKCFLSSQTHNLHPLPEYHPPSRNRYPPSNQYPHSQHPLLPPRQHSPYSQLNSNNKKYSYNHQILEQQQYNSGELNRYRGREIGGRQQRRSVTPDRGNRRFNYSQSIGVEKQESYCKEKRNQKNIEIYKDRYQKQQIENEKMVNLNERDNRNKNICQPAETADPPLPNRSKQSNEMDALSKKLKNDQYKSLSFGIKRLDDMPAAAKEIYARIQPRSHYDANKSSEEANMVRTKGRRQYDWENKFGGKQKVENQNRPLALSEELSKQPSCSQYSQKQESLNNTQKISPSPYKSSQNNQNNPRVSNQLYNNQREIQTSKPHHPAKSQDKLDTKKYLYRQSDNIHVPLQRNNPNVKPLNNNNSRNLSQLDNRIKRQQGNNTSIATTGNIYQRPRTIQKYTLSRDKLNQVREIEEPQPTSIIRHLVDIQQPYHNILKQPSVPQSTYESLNSTAKQAIKMGEYKTRGSVDEEQFVGRRGGGGYVGMRGRWERRQELKEKDGGRVNDKYDRERREERDGNRYSNANANKTHAFSRQLNEYQDEALNKIKTINQLNNKIGQRIRNILSSIN